MKGSVCLNFGSPGGLGLRCLPPEIFRMVLQYLRIPSEIRALDNAILNHELRSLYLQTLNGMTLEEYHHNQRSCLTTIDVYWMLMKNIRFLKISMEDYSEGTVFLIFNSRHTLTSLSLCFDSSHPNRISSDLARIGHFPSLVSLTIRSRVSPTHAFPIESFCSKNPQLETLEIKRIHISSEIFSKTLQFCHNLTNLDVSNNQWFNDECVEMLIRNLPKLQCLDVRDTSIESLQSIKSILDSFPSLTYHCAYESKLSLEAKKYYLQEYCIRRILSNDPQLQVSGLLGIGELITVVSDIDFFFFSSIAVAHGSGRGRI
jgi:Leucine-rich repeat (LRR) protein